jgi:hypothetical protein
MIVEVWRRWLATPKWALTWSQLCVWRITSQQFRVATRCTFCGSSAARVIETLMRVRSLAVIHSSRSSPPRVLPSCRHAARLCPRRLLESEVHSVLLQKGRHTRLCRLLTENRYMLVDKCFHEVSRLLLKDHRLTLPSHRTERIFFQFKAGAQDAHTHRRG